MPTITRQKSNNARVAPYYNNAREPSSKPSKPQSERKKRKEVMVLRERYADQAMRCLAGAERQLLHYILHIIMAPPRDQEEERRRTDDDEAALGGAMGDVAMAGRVENEYQWALKQAGLLGDAATMPELATLNPKGQTFFRLEEALKALRPTTTEKETEAQRLYDGMRDAHWRIAHACD